MPAPRGLVLSHQAPRLGRQDAGESANSTLAADVSTRRGGRLNSAISQPPRSGRSGWILWAPTSCTSSAGQTQTGYTSESTMARYGGPAPLRGPRGPVGVAESSTRHSRIPLSAWHYKLVQDGPPTQTHAEGGAPTVRDWDKRRPRVDSSLATRCHDSDAGTPGREPTRRVRRTS